MSSYHVTAHSMNVPSHRLHSSSKHFQRYPCGIRLCTCFNTGKEWRSLRKQRKTFSCSNMKEKKCIPAVAPSDMQSSDQCLRRELTGVVRVTSRSRSSSVVKCVLGMLLFCCAGKTGMFSFQSRMAEILHSEANVLSLCHNFIFKFFHTRVGGKMKQQIIHGTRYFTLFSFLCFGYNT